MTIENIKAVGYVRLSKADYDMGQFDESESIRNQKDLIESFANNRGWELSKFYVDEDISGSDRERPEFNRMILDAYAHEFNVIVVKKQARFARDFTLIEKYILGEFIELGIRFVSILDNIDTKNILSNVRKQSQMFGLVDQWYLEDLSDNVKSAFRGKAEKGICVASFAKYGYKKDPERKGHLIPDENVSGNVQRIFELYAAGYGVAAIANIFNEEGIPNPYGYKKGFTNIRIHKETPLSTLWRGSTISTMLEDRTYIGAIISHKFTKPSYKSKKLLRVPKDEWKIKENCHEPIIDKELWNKVQEIKKNKNMRSTKGGERHPLSGKIFCGNCRRPMLISGASGKSKCRIYACSTRRVSKELCAGSGISEKRLEDIILDKLKMMIKEYLDKDYQIDNMQEVSDESSIIIKQLKNVDNEISKLDKQIEILYNDRLEENITLSLFQQAQDGIEQRKKKLLEKRALLEVDLSAQKKKTEIEDIRNETLKKYSNITELTREIVDSLIEAIYVTNKEKQNKEIEIVWTF